MKANLGRLAGAKTILAFIAAVSIGCSGADNTGPEPPVDEGQAPVAGCSDGLLEHGALYRICFPANWNGDLVIYAHGYVAADQELALPQDQIGGQSVSGTVTGLGYAFATTSYRANGLVGPEGAEDLVELDATVQRLYRPDPGRSVVVGVSEGGLIATLAAERHSDRFAGALAACGPVGSFRRQLEYFDDFRVVFDYLFPGVIPGSAVEIPDAVRTGWEPTYQTGVAAALLLNPARARELVNITGVPVASADLSAIVVTAIGILWYNVIGSANAQARLGGQPFDNSSRVYSGSSDDAALNAGVARFAADPATFAVVAQFETTGSLPVPLVTVHTDGDPIVPFEHEALYAEKVSQAGAAARLTQTSFQRYGHCAFQSSELLAAFSTLIDKVVPPAATSFARSDSR